MLVIKSVGGYTDVINKSTETSTYASKEVGLEVNTKKTKHIFISRHQNARKGTNIKIAKIKIKMWQSIIILE
jgi:hypothetical protein